MQILVASCASKALGGLGIKRLHQQKQMQSVLLVVKQDFLFPLVQEMDKNILLQKYIQGTQQQNGDIFPSSTQNVKNYREKVQ